MCPVCESALESRAVAPCLDCGHELSELDELRRGEHEYHVYELWDEQLVLCDFCDADFGSYYPEYWGLPQGPLPDYPLKQVRKLEHPSIEADWYCATCKHRLAFLTLLKRARAKNAL